MSATNSDMYRSAPWLLASAMMFCVIGLARITHSGYSFDPANVELEFRLFWNSMLALLAAAFAEFNLGSDNWLFEHGRFGYAWFMAVIVAYIFRTFLGRF